MEIEEAEKEIKELKEELMKFKNDFYSHYHISNDYGAKTTEPCVHKKEGK